MRFFVMIVMITMIIMGDGMEITVNNPTTTASFTQTFQMVNEDSINERALSTASRSATKVPNHSEDGETGSPSPHGQTTVNTTVAVMKFREFIVSRLTEPRCITMNMSAAGLSENIAKTISCLVLFSTWVNRMFCFKSQHVDIQDQNLDSAILLKDNKTCFTDEDPTGWVICASVEKHDGTSVNKVCWLQNRKPKERFEAKELRQQARRYCGYSDIDNTWQLKTAKSPNECGHTAKVLSDLIQLEMKRAKAAGVPIIMAGISISLELVCIAGSLREAVKKRKTALLFVMVSVSDVISLSYVILLIKADKCGPPEYFCVIGDFVNFFATALSGSVNVQLVFTRLVAVAFPLKVKDWCNKRRTVMGVGISAMVSAAVCALTGSPNFFNNDLSKGRSRDLFTRTTRIIYYITSVMAPVLMVISLSAWMVVELFIKNRERTESFQNLPPLPQWRITFGIITTVIIFLLVQIPVSVLEAYIFFVVNAMVHDNQAYYVLLNLRCIAGALNFIARLVFLKDFRTVVLKPVFLIWRQFSRESPAVNTR